MRIEVKNLNYTYSKGLPYETKALSDISFVAEQGDFIAIVGSTGSGKTTLVEHLNGLLKPESGCVLADGKDISLAESKVLRHKIGLVFQYPEYQLFEETVIKDVMFGPKNSGCSDAEAENKAIQALNMVGLNASEIAEKSPFSLSGGQKRRVAIAGVIAMQPEVLILDEPAAGLDPKGRKDIFNMIKKVKKENNMTVFLVTHNMDDAAEFADKIIVLKRGSIRLMGSPETVFRNQSEVLAAGLDLPYGPAFSCLLKEKGLVIPKTVGFEETADAIAEHFKKTWH